MVPVFESGGAEGLPGTCLCLRQVLGVIWYLHVLEAGGGVTWYLQVFEAGGGVTWYLHVLEAGGGVTWYLCLNQVVLRGYLVPTCV